MPTDLKIGIIGGSGMEDPTFISDYSKEAVSTPYGDPSSELIVGKIANVSVVILSRHGLVHSTCSSSKNMSTAFLF